MKAPSTEGLDPGGGPTSLLKLTLERNVHAPSVARAAVSARMRELGIEGSIAQTLVLLVSEVVSNAVRHSAGPADSSITLTANVTADVVGVAVTDAGDGFTPRPREPGSLSDGYGLYLLDKAASNWGVKRTGGTTVWFELDRGGGEL